MVTLFLMMIKLVSTVVVYGTKSLYESFVVR